jgi:hypothetical protein
MDVVHGLDPEGCVRTRVGTVERHLELGRHAPTLAQITDNERAHR